MLSSRIVLHLSVANYLIYWTHCKISWKGRLESHGSANLERLPMMSWYSTWSYYMKRYAIMYFTYMCAKIRLISNTPSSNVLVTDYVTCFFSASSRFTHSLCSLHVSAWYRFRFPILSGWQMVLGREAWQMCCLALWFCTPCWKRVLRGIRTCLILSWI